MSFSLRPALIFVFFCISFTACYAEGMPKDLYTARLLELNRVKPAQNPIFTLGKRTLDARIVDKNQRTIGKIEDIILTPDGHFQTLVTKIDSSGFREMAAFDVASYVVEPTPDTFTVSMDKTQIKQNLQQLLASIPAASGEDGPFTLKSIQNGFVMKQDGTQIAQVQNALVDSKAGQIMAMLVTISTGDHRGKTIAIPYEAATAKLIEGKAVMTVTDEQAQIMSSMATNR